MASLSIQSLNQFAECMSKAEALSAEIAGIQRGLHGDATPATDQRVSKRGKKTKHNHAGMAQV
jgi:hypothetical protein